MAKVYVAYYRVSTARQGRSGLGLDAQRRSVEEHIGRAPHHEFTEVESGKRLERPELRKALELAELTGATLIVAKLDRLSRDAAFLITLQNAGIPIIFADMPQADKLVIGVMAMLAEWELERIGQRTKEALAAAKARGQILGGNAITEKAAAAGKERGAAVLARVRAVGTARSAERRTETAKRRIELIRPHVEAGLDLGLKSTRAMAIYLNTLGITTPRGAHWQSGSVARLMAAL